MNSWTWPVLKLKQLDDPHDIVIMYNNYVIK